MRRFWPRSAFGRTVAVTVGAIVVGQILSAVMLGFFVLRPQAERVGGIVAQAVYSVSQAAENADPATRARMIAALDASDYLRVSADARPPSTGAAAPRLLELFFMQGLVDAMAPRTQLTWRTDNERTLWLRVRIGPEMYWISSEAPKAMQPLTAVGWSAVLAFGLSLLVAVALQRPIVRPLERLTAAVGTPRAALEGVAVDRAAAREVVALATAFNAMSARLAGVEKERALMLAGLSHDLRTPLSKLRLAIEMAPGRDDSLVASAHRQVKEIDRLLGQFLVFARGVDGEAVRDIDLDTLVEECLALQLVEGREFRRLGGKLGQLRGRPEGLRRALLNLMENAARYGAPPFSLECARDGQAVRIRIIDGGPGVAADALSKIVEPFTRANAHAMPGSGLGLAIAAQAARAHGGDLHVANVSEGGFSATLELSL